MPTKKNVETQVNESEVDLATLLEQEKEKNKKLEDKVDKLSELMEQLLKEKQEVKVEPKQEESKKRVRVFDKYKEIEPTRRVLLVSLSDAKCVYTTTTGKKIVFDKFGEVQHARFEDVEDIYRKYKSYFTNMEIRVLDDDVIDALYLRPIYNKHNVDVEDLENIIELEPQAMIERLKSLPKPLQETAISLIIMGIAQNNVKYMDRNKWQLINNAFGVDVNEFVDNYAIALNM